MAAHPTVAECAVIGVRDEIKGQVPRGFVVLKTGVDASSAQVAQVAQEIVRSVREQIGAVAALKDVTVVEALPKTRSGKILRGAMRDIADGTGAPPPATVEDPSVLESLRAVLVRQPAH